MRNHDYEGGESGRASRDRITDDRIVTDTEAASWAAAGGNREVLSPRDILALQRTAGNAGVAQMMADDQPDVQDVVGSGGAPLDAGVRTDMESRFGQDFGDVRVHSGADAHASAVGLSAQAYTVGSDIVFQQGNYDPASSAGQHMLAHELTHVVQQRNGPVDGTDNGSGVRVSDPGDSYERAASANADSIMSMPATAAPAAAGGSVQREGDDELLDAQTYVQRAEGPEELEDPEAAT
ncbi:MAG TPA: DUF4157 domain-containing protein [Micromonosporaceae bacterium]|jgi:hypothetical protein